jgi:ribosome-associated protein
MKKSELKRQVAEAVAACEAKKAGEITLLEMDPSSGRFTDYFVICSGSNPRQIQAISDEVEQKLASVGLRPNSIEGYGQAEWVLLDYVDFVVHVFSERARKYYDLERLWKSAKRMTLSELREVMRRPAAAAKRSAKAAGNSGTRTPARRTARVRKTASTRKH